MAEERKGDWCKTYSGVHFYPMDPRPEDFKIEDISHALSNQCRFSGHTAIFFSVAQHSILVAKTILMENKPREVVLAGLLHDAAETYLVDIPSPIKRMLPDYSKMEGIVSKALAEKFGVPYPWPKCVKDADVRATYAEARELAGGYEDWGVQIPNPLPGRIVPMEPRVAKAIFMRWFRGFEK